MSTHNICFCREIRKILNPHQGASNAYAQNTPQSLYNTVRYNTVLYITQFKDGSQKCIDYIEKLPMVIFQYNLYIFVWLNNTVYAMDPNNSVIKRLW